MGTQSHRAPKTVRGHGGWHIAMNVSECRSVTAYCGGCGAGGYVVRGSSLALDTGHDPPWPCCTLCLLRYQPLSASQGSALSTELSPSPSLLPPKVTRGRLER